MLMHYRILLIIATLILTSISALAQMNVGGWKIHPVFGTEVTDIFDTGKKVYYLVDGNLYCYDKDSEENEFLSKQTVLNDIDISRIFYNYDSRYLLVVYANSNIDIINDDGTVVNVPDISQADLDVKTVNNVSFKNNKVYIATAFGYVVLNSEKGFEIMESQIFGAGIASVVEVGNLILISKNDGLFYCPVSKPTHPLSAFKLFYQNGNAQMYGMDDATFLVDDGWVYKFAITDGEPKFTSTAYSGHFKMFSRSSDGYIAIDISTPGNLLRFDAGGNLVASMSLPDDMQNSLVASCESDGSLWELSPDGVRHIKLENGEVTTVFNDYFKYNASSVAYPNYLRYNSALKKLFVMDCGPQIYKGGYNIQSQINTLENGFWTDVSPSEAPTCGTYSDNKLKDIYSPVFDPDDPNTYYVGTWFEGVYKISGGKVVSKYDWNTAPFFQGWSCCISGLAFDKDKNLWAVQTLAGFKVHVLPRAKQQLAETSPSDWITLDVDILNPNFKSQIMITKKNNIKVITTDGSAGTLIFIDDGGNPASSSIKTAIFEPEKLYDQDEKAYSWINITSLVEDASGKVWMGSSNGVIEFNPANAFNSNFRINRIKVPRNDGTNYADYLLSGTAVTAIAVDGANRKWIGTLDMGLYLVSPDGTKILKHFTTDNSHLTSNHVVSICCDPNNNTVYVGTPSGLVEYYSDAAPASEDYSNIYAYPNPVRPDYTGEIIITGLMDNSLVKIADAGGNVIRSIQSTSGMATWDGCYSNGERVRTGVYYVLASQNETGKSSGVVTKILFIK